MEGLSRFYQMPANDMISSMTRRVVLLCLLLMALAPAADVDGIWTGRIAGRNNDLQDITFRFKVEGGILTGKMYGENDDLPIADGKIEGDQISFTVPSDFGGGRFRFMFHGTVGAGEIRLTREREGGSRDGAGKERGNTSQTVTLKRV
jgi:hypothetical protein